MIYEDLKLRKFNDRNKIEYAGEIINQYKINKNDIINL